jgi:predicted  nucleic acid-binding Zn-ribbon protein
MKMENETIEIRIEKMEYDVEDLNNEIQMIEGTLEKMKEMKDRIPIKDINIKVGRYIKDLENHKRINEELKEQIEHDIKKMINKETNVRGLNKWYFKN